MQIYEINKNVNRIGLRQGALSTYICTYHEKYEFTVMAVDEILDEVADYGNKVVTIIGDAPLLQKDMPELVAGLLDEGYLVNVETIGDQDLRIFEDKVVDILANDESLNNLQYVLDYKGPSTGFAVDMIETNINFLIDDDCLVFKIREYEDLVTMHELLEEFEPPAAIFAMAEGVSERVIVDYLEANNLQQVRLTAEYVIE